MAHDASIKLVMLGDTGVGKTSLLGRFATGNFDKYTESTIGVSAPHCCSPLLLAPLKHAFLAQYVATWRQLAYWLCEWLLWMGPLLWCCDRTGREHIDRRSRRGASGLAIFPLAFLLLDLAPFCILLCSVSFVQQTLEVDGRSVQFHIHDTAGQEKYRGLAPLYYRKAHAAIVVGTCWVACACPSPCTLPRLAAQVYDITSQSSFAALQSWVKELRDNGPDGAVICVCGNKVDCESSRVRRLRGLLLDTPVCVCMPAIASVPLHSA